MVTIQSTVKRRALFLDLLLCVGSGYHSYESFILMFVPLDKIYNIEIPL